ncbi:metallophosphoesterase [Robertmurraya yapensis]|uniref:Metallophosphoesterase n=1 Tax=Bacillus yapensis TaxID=2492960 RepID=A0A431W6A6_9BACI|nr:metallophosphoesterase [Bacillus yapensis]RTR31029.1 metallophosphoesterase [Bacillus yapensis]TKS95458.1 metallophosphoesterase [Bacillus yapensis]
MKLLLITALLIIIIIIVYFFKKAYLNTKDIAINKIEINQTEMHQPTLKILHLSDLHLENISITPDELYGKLKDESVDLIALTGDFLDRKRSIPKLIPYLEILNQLHPTYGMFAVLGNHDYVLKGKNLNELTQTLEQYNCKVMRNETREIFIQGTRINIIGIDDFSTKRSNLEMSYKGLKEGYNLVLTHDPNLVLHMKNYHFDYLLAGHFHGGQICYPKAYHLVKMGKLVRMNMIKGLQRHDDKPFYISEGLGQTGVNIRVGSRPEITIHEIGLSKIISDEIRSVI